MSPDKCPNSPHILTSAYLLLSSVISSSLKSPFNLILLLCPGKWPPPPPAPFSPPSSTPSPEVCPSSLCLGTLKLPYTWNAAFQIPDSCFWWLPADHSRTEFWWGGIFQQYPRLGLMLRLLQPVFSTSTNQSQLLPNTTGQHQWQKRFLFYIPKQSEIGLLRASNAQAH